MILLALIALASLSGFVVTWFAWAWGHDGRGNPVLSMLVAFAIALLWGRGMERLEQAFAAGRDDVVNRRLRLWGAAIGAFETILIKLRMAVEGGKRAETEAMLKMAGPLGIAPFATSMAASMNARLHDDTEGAMLALTRGIDSCSGIDRTELLVERCLLLLENGLLKPLNSSQIDDIVLDLNTADVEVRDLIVSRQRNMYLSLLLQDARALLYLTQGRVSNGLRILDTAIRRSSDPMSLRCRAMEMRLRIERVLMINGTVGQAEALTLLAEVHTQAKRPLWEMRINDIETWFALEAVRKQEAITAAAERLVKAKESVESSTENEDDAGIAVPWTTPGV